MDDAKKKVEDEHLLDKNALKAVQDDLTKVKADAKAVSEAQKKEIKRLKAKIEKLEGEKDKKLSNAYSTGFAAYLQNFLAGDPDSDWSCHFAPSNPDFMINFKVQYAAKIAKAKADLEAKIAKELELLKNKEEVGGKETHAEGDTETVVASPINTGAS